MSDKPKVRLVADEDASIVEQLDRIATAEGVARSDLIRRAIRRLIFLTPVPTSEQNSQLQEQPA